MTITVYGLKNCDSCRKALKALKAEGEEVVLHDFRQDGLTRETINQWIADLGADTLVNRKSTTWRSLDEAVRERVEQGDLLDVLHAHPTLIKRPVIETQKGRYIGWSKAVQTDLLGKQD